MNRREFLKSLGLTAAAVGFGGLPALVGASSSLPGRTGKAIGTTGWAVDEALDVPLMAGDVFTVQGIFAVNPVTRKATDYLQQFVITAVADNEVSFHPFHADVSKRKKNRLGMPSSMG